MVEQPLDVDVVGWVGLIDGCGRAAQQCERTRAVSSLHMRDGHRELGESLPQLPLGVTGLLPHRLEDLVRVKRLPAVEEVLGGDQGLERGEDRVLGNTGYALNATG
jgi:hypothetical protein